MHRTLIAFAAAFMLLANFGTAAFAQSSSCSGLVVDDAKALGNKLNDVKNAAQDLQNIIGNNGVVRILVANTPVSNNATKDITDFRASLSKNCADWNKTGTMGIIIGANGNVPANIRTDLVVGGSTGNFWANVLDKTAADNIRTTYINAQLQNVKASNRSDDNANFYAQALTGAIGQFKTLVQRQLSATVRTGNNTLQAPTTQTVVQNKPADLTGLWLALVLVILIVAIVLIYRVWYSASSAKKAAASAKTNAVNAFTGLDSRSTALKSQAANLKESISETAYRRLQQLVTAATDQVDNVAFRYGTFDSNPNSSVDDWSRIQQSADTAARSLSQAENACKELEQNPHAWDQVATPPPPRSAPTSESWAPPVVNYPTRPAERRSYETDFDRPRRDEQDALSRAESVVQDADDYLEEHWRYMTPNAKSLLQSAFRALSRSDAHEATRLGRAAKQQAHSDYQFHYDYSRTYGYLGYQSNWYDGPTVVVVERPTETVYVRENGRQETIQQGNGSGRAESGGSTFDGAQPRAESGGDIFTTQPAAESGGGIDYSGGSSTESGGSIDSGSSDSGGGSGDSGGGGE